MKSIIVFATLVITITPFITGYGFDGGTSCTPKSTRRGRAQILTTIPCDLTVQTYCNLPGTQYPWHAVRRFVHENQGLMKRMYGDVRHISILRTEINNNDIELEDMAKTAARYSRSGWKKNKYLYSDVQNSKNNDVLTEPHFRPASTTNKPSTSGSTSVPSTTLNNQPNRTSTSPTVDVPNTSERNTEEVTMSADHLKVIPLDHTKSTTSNPFENITSPTDHMSSSETIRIVEPPNLTRNKSESATISTTLRIFLPAKSSSEGSSITAPPDDESVSTTTGRNTEDTMKYPEKLTHEVDKQSEIKKDEYKSKIPEVTSKQANKNIRPNENLEGQLFQDVTDKKEVPVMSNRGVNACPVKEEVVAPFWANNTRGEVLALLNLYPFEQYVHWEKCTSEHKQMYCREGCRCEQQYRLHRLLAYDPHNECRGIFSDWFRFPSCCICKCYDIPIEYRMTSRSPRSMIEEDEMEKIEPNPFDVASDNVQQAQYDFASREEWYRPVLSDENDLEAEFS